MSQHEIDLHGGQHAVLLIHGLTGSPFELKPLARRLHKDGFTVKAPCLAGHGSSISELRTTTWHDWYTTVHTTFLQLKRDYRSVSVSGLCMGALLALFLSYKESAAVSSISVLSTTLFYDGWSLPWYRFLLPISYYPPIKYFYSYEERTPYGIKDERMRRHIEIAIKEKKDSLAYSHFPSKNLHELFKLIRTVKKVLYKIPTPTLILHALDDDIASTKNADYIERNIGASTVRKVLIEDTYHMLTLDRQKDLVAQEIIDFFKTHAL
ncbi:MAG: alpha/beta fold hydrolase [Nitrospirae bacterium]|nr:alpha/beta fold hydrolase [Nitrospirota bacterium]MBF0592537.1 alpha/beta fold hydrolase [Nitrospirota bacterium]